jgi:TonB family protein
MTREHTSLNLAIGLIFSVLMHLSIVMWGLPVSLEMPALQSSSEVEVQLREWPAAPAPPPPAEVVRIEESAPPDPTPVPAAKPSLPPNLKALQDAVLASVQPEHTAIPAPERLPALPTVDSQMEPVQLPPALRDASQPELRITDLPSLPDLPAPERTRGEADAVPALPALERYARREEPAARPTTVALPRPGVASSIKGPAAERQVIFQPPPPTVTVESESELELRFWILPNGAVGRVVPVKKTDPRLEALAINYLRSWRFNPLPSEALQDEQWGVIPFKFRIR